MKKKITKINIRVILFILFCIVTEASFSQQVNLPGEIKQQISIDLVHHILKDNLVSDGTITGNGLKLAYTISKAGLKRKTLLTAGYEETNFENEIQKTKQHSFTLNLSDGFNVLAKRSKRISAYIGYALSSDPSYTSGNSKSKNGYSWNSSSLISLYQSYGYLWKRQAINLAITVPVAGAIYRPEQAEVDSDEKNINTVLTSFYSNPSFASFHNYLAMDISFSYQRQISTHLNISGQYNFNYRKWSGEYAFADKAQNIGVSLIYKSLH